MSTKKDREITQKIVKAQNFDELVDGFVQMHSPNTSDESIENRAPDTPKICPRASRERKPPHGKTNWEIRMDHERNRSGSRGRLNHSKERLSRHQDNDISPENPMASSTTTPESSDRQGMSHRTPEMDDDETLLFPEEPTPRVDFPGDFDGQEGQVVSEYRTEKNIVRIRRVIEFSPPRTVASRTSQKTPLRSRNENVTGYSHSAPRPKTSSGIPREPLRPRASATPTSVHQSLPSSPQVGRRGRPGRAPGVVQQGSKIPLKRGSSLENKMKSIEKKVNQIQHHLKMHNIEQPHHVLPNDVCAETAKRDLMLHETVCETAAVVRQKILEDEQNQSMEASNSQLSKNPNGSLFSKTPSPNKSSTFFENCSYGSQEIPVPIYKSINSLFESSPQKRLDQWQPMDRHAPRMPENHVHGSMSAENPLLDLGSSVSKGQKRHFVDPYQISRLSETLQSSPKRSRSLQASQERTPLKDSSFLPPNDGSDLERTPIKPGVYTTMTLPKRQVEDEAGYAIPGSTRAVYMNLAYDSVSKARPIAESTPIGAVRLSHGIDKTGYRTPSPVERILERKRVNRSLGFDDLVKANDPTITQLSPTKYQRSISQERDPNFKRNVSFSPKINTTYEEDFKSAVEESFETEEREQRLSSLGGQIQRSPYRSASAPMKNDRLGLDSSNSGYTSTVFSSESLRSLGEQAVLAEKLNRSLEQVNVALDRSRSQLDKISDKFDQTLNNVNHSIRLSQSVQEIQSIRRSPAYKAFIRPTLHPPPPPPMVDTVSSKSPVSIQLTSTLDGNNLESETHLKPVDTSKLKPTLTSPPPSHKPSTSATPVEATTAPAMQTPQKRVEFDRKNLKEVEKEAQPTMEFTQEFVRQKTPYIKGGSFFNSGSESTSASTRKRSQSIDDPIQHRQTAASITLLHRAQELYKRHKQALKDYTKVKILAYNVKADEYRKTGNSEKYQDLKAKIDLLIKRCNEEKKAVKEAYRNPNRELLKDYAKKIEDIQKATMEMQEKASKPKIRRRTSSASSSASTSTSSSITTASMLQDPDYTQKMSVLRQRRENADRVLRIAQKLKKEEKDVEKLERKAFFNLSKISTTSELLETSLSERDIPRKLATVAQNVDQISYHEEKSPPQTAGRSIEARNALLREELEKKRRFSEKLYKEFCQRNKEMLQNEEISLNTQIDAYTKYIEEAQKLEELERRAHEVFSTEDEKLDDSVFTSSSVKLSATSGVSTPSRRDSLEDLQRMPKLSSSRWGLFSSKTIFRSPTPNLGAPVPRLSLSSSESIHPPNRKDPNDSSRTLTEFEELQVHERNEPKKILTPAEASVPRLDLSAIHRELSVEHAKKLDKEHMEMPSNIAYKPESYERDVQQFVHDAYHQAHQDFHVSPPQQPNHEANKETSRGISSIHEHEDVPPPVAQPPYEEKKCYQTSADREKNTENDVSSIQDIQEIPDSSPRSPSCVGETPLELIGAHGPSQNHLQPPAQAQDRSESVFTPLENVISTASSLDSLPMDNAISGLEDLPSSRHEVEEPSHSASKQAKNVLGLLNRQEERDKESDPERVPSVKSHLNLSNSSISKREEDEHSPIPTPPYVEPSVMTSIGSRVAGSHQMASGGGSRIISQFSSSSSRASMSAQGSTLGSGSRKSSEEGKKDGEPGTVQPPQEPLVTQPAAPSPKEASQRTSSISSLASSKRSSLQDLMTPPASSTGGPGDGRVPSTSGLQTAHIDSPVGSLKSRTTSTSSTTSPSRKSLQELLSPVAESLKKVEEMRAKIERAKAASPRRLSSGSSLVSMSSLGQVEGRESLKSPLEILAQEATKIAEKRDQVAEKGPENPKIDSIRSVSSVSTLSSLKDGSRKDSGPLDSILDDLRTPSSAGSLARKLQEISEKSGTSQNFASGTLKMPETHAKSLEKPLETPKIDFVRNISSISTAPSLNMDPKQGSKLENLASEGLKTPLSGSSIHSLINGLSEKLPEVIEFEGNESMKTPSTGSSIGQKSIGDLISLTSEGSRRVSPKKLDQNPTLPHPDVRISAKEAEPGSIVESIVEEVISEDAETVEDSSITEAIPDSDRPKPDDGSSSPEKSSESPKSPKSTSKSGPSSNSVKVTVTQTEVVTKTTIETSELEPSVQPEPVITSVDGTPDGGTPPEVVLEAEGTSEDEKSTSSSEEDTSETSTDDEDDSDDQSTPKTKPVRAKDPTSGRTESSIAEEIPSEDVKSAQSMSSGSSLGGLSSSFGQITLKSGVKNEKYDFKAIIQEPKSTLDPSMAIRRPSGMVSDALESKKDPERASEKLEETPKSSPKSSSMSLSLFSNEERARKPSWLESFGQKSSSDVKIVKLTSKFDDLKGQEHPQEPYTPTTSSKVQVIELEGAVFDLSHENFDSKGLEKPPQEPSASLENPPPALLDVHPEPPKLPTSKHSISEDAPLPKHHLSSLILEDDYSPAARMEKAKARFIQRVSLPPLSRTDSMDSINASTPKQSPRSPSLSGRFFDKWPKNASPRMSPRNSFPMGKVGTEISPRFSLLDKDLISFSPRDHDISLHKKRTSSISSEKSILDESERSTGRLSNKSSVGFLEESLHMTNLLDLSDSNGSKTTLNLEDLKTDSILDSLQVQKQKASISTIPEEDSIASTVSSEFQISTESGTSVVSSSSETVSASEPDLPNSELEIRLLARIFTKQLWPQFEVGQKDFMLKLEKIENGKKQHDEYEESYIQALADFALEIVKQMASNQRFVGPNQVWNRFYPHSKPTTYERFSKMVEEEICTRVLRLPIPGPQNGFKSTPEQRYERVYRGESELDPIDHLTFDELYKSEVAWKASINKFMEKNRNIDKSINQF